jgi:hypothetical protein
MTDLGTLGETVQALRAREFPHLPAALVDELLRIEAENLEDRTRARDLVDRAITRHIAAGGAT